jgi:hypothetical protein
VSTHVHHAAEQAAADAPSLNRTAALATLHCLTGCTIGEVLGMVIGTALGWSNAATIALAVTLAFVFGYSLTMLPLLRAGMALAVVLPLAFAADSFSIAVMEIVDNGIMLAIPGAMDARLSSGVFWGALAVALAVAYVVAFPVNRRMISRGRGHAVVHAFHGSGHGPEHDDGTAAHRASGWSPEMGSRRGFIAMGLVSMLATIAIATTGALLIDHGSDEPHPTAHEEVME